MFTHSTRRGGLLGALVVAALVALAATPAAALADAEPNDFIWQAEGPFAGGTTVSGSIASPDAGDWFVFYAAAQQQLHLTSSGCPEVRLKDTDGAPLDSDHTTPVGGISRYFVHVGYGDDCETPSPAYAFRVDPAGAVVGGPSAKLAPTPTGEPNEGPGQAQGPLQAGPLYTGARETSNDQDWFKLYTPPGVHQLDVELYRRGGDCDTYLRLYTEPASDEDDYQSAVSYEWSSAEIQHISLTSQYAQTLYLQAEPECTGDAWAFRIATPDVVTSTAPAPAAPPPPAITPANAGDASKCASAKRSLKRWNRKVAKTRKLIKRARRAHRTKRVRKLKKRLGAEKRTRKRVRDKVILRC
jgi:hypothetical protein